MYRQGQLAKAGPGGVQRGTMGAGFPAAPTGVSGIAQPPFHCLQKAANVRSKPCGDFFQLASLLHHNSTIFFLLPGLPGTRAGPTGCV